MLSNKAQPPQLKSARPKYCQVLSYWLTTPSMPPIPPPHIPRIVIYYQTQHNPDGTPCSILPNKTQHNISVTHVNVAAIHLNDPPGNIHLVGTPLLTCASLRADLCRMIMFHQIPDTIPYGPSSVSFKPPASKSSECWAARRKAPSHGSTLTK